MYDTLLFKFCAKCLRRVNMVFQVGLGGVVEIVRLFEMVWDGKSGKWESGSPTPGYHLRSHIRVAGFFLNLQLFANSGKHYQTQAARDWLPCCQNFRWGCCRTFSTSSLRHTDLGSTRPQAGESEYFETLNIRALLFNTHLAEKSGTNWARVYSFGKAWYGPCFFAQPTCSM